jgi:hypothetical protein
MAAQLALLARARVSKREIDEFQSFRCLEYHAHQAFAMSVPRFNGPLTLSLV